MLYIFFDDDLREKKYKNPTNSAPPIMFPNVTGTRLLIKKADQVKLTDRIPVFAVNIGSIV